MTGGPEMLLERVRAATADEYLIDREIGRGGMAAVFLARDIALDRRVAIKVMLPDLINVQGVQDRFVIEARTAAHLDHPGIVTVYAVKQRAGLLFIAMKYIEGHTLEAILRSQGQIDPTAVALIGSKVAEALHFAHGEGVVHRDVKPSNIMIDTRGRPVVTDFGIARVMTAQSITVAGSMLGTPTHMSPEQCRGLPATAASDQYSLGVTLYEMISGRPPFAGTLFELINAHREQSPPTLSEFVAGVDPALENTIMRMLAKEPSERWESLTDVAERLAAHTMVQQGDSNMRATLMMTGESSGGSTSGRGIGSADLLSPIPESSPASGSPWPPLSGSAGAPLTSIAASPKTTQPIAAPIVLTAAETSPQQTVFNARQRRMVTGAVVVATVILAWIGIAAIRRGEAPPAAAPSDSVPSVSAPIAPAAPSSAAALVPDSTRAAAVRDSIVRDSTARAAVARDSVARAVAVAARDSAVRDSVVRDSVARSGRRAAAAAVPVRPRVDSTRPARIRPESLTVQCARLLERVSLGEKLTDAERATLRQQCPK